MRFIPFRLPRPIQFARPVLHNRDHRPRLPLRAR
jgi:hypothetical protein